MTDQKSLMSKQMLYLVSCSGYYSSISPDGPPGVMLINQIYHTWACYKCSYICTMSYIRVFDKFEAWAILAQKWLVCTPFGIHFEPMNKELLLLVTIIIINILIH